MQAEEPHFAIASVSAGARASDVDRRTLQERTAPLARERLSALGPRRSGQGYAQADDDRGATSTGRLERVVAVQHAIATSDLPQQLLLELLAEQSMTMAGGDGVAVEYLDGPDLVYVATSGSLAESLGTRLPRAGSMSGLAADTGTILVAQDTATDSRANRQACIRLGIGSMILVPLRVGSTVVAVLKVAWRQPGAVTDNARTDLGLVSDVLAARLAHTQTLAALTAQQRDNEWARAELQLRTNQLALHVEATRAILLGDDARKALCDAALTATGAALAMVFESDGSGGLEATASSGLPVGPIRLAPDEPSITLDVWRTGRCRLLTDVHAEPGISGRLVTVLDALSDHPIRAMISLPVLSDDRTRDAVLSVVLDRALHGSTVELLGTLELLAAEAAIAFSREDQRRELGEQAHTDALTGVANRRRWDSALQAALATATRSGTSLTVGILDLDLFKAYNDTRGHPAGDALLITVSRAWQTALRDEGLLARLGGEEFGLLLPGCVADAAAGFADLLRELVPDGQTVSIGLTSHRPTDSPGDIMSRADAALYTSKTTGRNRVTVHPV